MTLSGRAGRRLPFRSPPSRTLHLLKLEPERFGEEDRHLAPRDIAIRAVVAATTAHRHPRLDERLDELKPEVRGRHVAEGRRQWSRTDLELVSDIHTRK